MGLLRRGRVGLWLSVAVVLVHWAVSIGRVWSQRSPAVPGSVQALAVYACLKAVITMAVVWPLLWASSEGLESLGLVRRGWKSTLVRGVVWGIGIFLVVDLMLGSVLSTVLPSGGTSPAMRTLFRDPSEAPYWIIAAVIGGGFCEELQRAFALTRFENGFGRVGLVFAIAVDSAVFGLGHLYQGRVAAVVAGVSGVVFAMIFLRRRRVGDAMVAHAVVDLIGMAAAYALYGRGG